ncbi:MAG: L,D-transpeptidase family protein [Alphaproteobacteria bacterium]
MNSLPVFLTRSVFAVLAGLTLISCGSPGSMPAAPGNPSQVAHTATEFSSTGSELTAAFVSEVNSPAQTRTSDLKKFYKDQDYFTTFYRNGRWTWAGNQAFAALKNAASEGLRPESYLPISMLQSRSLSTVDPRTADVLLTSGIMAYMADLHQGVHNPSRKNIGPKLLREGIERSDFNVFLAGLAPKGRSYSALKSVLNGRRGPLSNAQRRQVALNMERLRWDHEAAGALRDIRVNIASQTMEMFEKGRKVHEMVVVVGRKSRKTPSLQDRVVSLKFSPDWTAPRTIVEEDYLDQAQADPAYFDQKGWQIYVEGERVESASLDWNTVDLDAVTVRQPSGASNALGGVRFSLTNNQAIYLHDTNAHSLFKKVERLYSSGCVRVEDAAWLAHWIMEAEKTPMSLAQVKKNMDLSSPKTVQLANPVPVSIAYLTVWVDGSNVLHWEDDVYNHDARLMKKMKFPAAWGGNG